MANVKAANGGWASALGALGLAGLGQLLLSQGQESTAKGVLGVLAFFLAALWVQRAFRNTGESSPFRAADEPSPRWLEATALGLILLVALATRLYNIDVQPNAGYRDEGSHGNLGLNILQGEVVEGSDTRYPVYIEPNFQNAMGFIYPTAVFLKWFGINILSVRYLAIFFSVLSCIAFYYLARLMLGAPLAGLLGIAFAAMRWHVNFGRIGFPQMMTILFGILFIYYFWRGLYRDSDNESRQLKPWMLWAAAGLSLARASVNIHNAASFPLTLLFNAPLMVCVWMMRKDGRSMDLFLGGAALAICQYTYTGSRMLVLVAPLLAFFAIYLHRQPLRRSDKALFWIWGLLALIGGVILIKSNASSAARNGLAGILALAVAAYCVLRRERLKGWLRPLGAFVAGGFIFGAPLINFIITDYKTFSARSDRVSIFNDKESDKRPWGIRLTKNILPTLGMYTVRGDGNPRHNLPGKPMLDPVSSALFMMSVFYCLLNWRRPRPFFYLLWWQVTLLAGYFTIEAPQASRTIVSIPLMLLMPGYMLERMLVGLRRKSEDANTYLLTILGVALSASLAYGLKVYFVEQRSNPGCWAEFSANEFMMGRDLKAAQPNTHGLIRPDWADSYVFRFQTWPERDFERFDPSDHVPFRDPERLMGKNLMYFLDESYLPLREILQDFYPHGVYREQRHLINGEFLYWTYLVPNEDLVRSGKLETGLRAKYYYDGPGTHWKGATVKERVDPFVLFNWTVDPVPAPFSVEWTGRIKLGASGGWRFALAANDYADLFIDGKKILVREHEYGHRNQVESQPVQLSAGWHDIKVRYYEARNYSYMELKWGAPGQALRTVPSSALSPR